MGAGSGERNDLHFVTAIVHEDEVAAEGSGSFRRKRHADGATGAGANLRPAGVGLHGQVATSTVTKPLPP